MDSGILTPQKLVLKFPLQPRPMQLTVSQCKLGVWVFEWVVMSSQKSPSLVSSGNCCFSSVRSSRQNKQTEVGETLRSSSKQNIKSTEGFRYFNAPKTSFKVPVFATPNAVDRESVQNKSLGF